MKSFLRMSQATMRNGRGQVVPLNIMPTPIAAAVRMALLHPRVMAANDRVNAGMGHTHGEFLAVTEYAFCQRVCMLAAINALHQTE